MTPGIQLGLCGPPREASARALLIFLSSGRCYSLSFLSALLLCCEWFDFSQHLQGFCKERKLCAYSGVGSNRLSFGKGTKLLVTPNVKNPDPAVYQLRSPGSSRTSLCLFTDFDSNTDVPQATGSSAFGSKSTVLDMRSTHSKSYGALLWSNSTDFECEDTFNETFYSSSEFPCDVTSVQKSFETDINLNFQNLSVIGFRILLLKVAGFNVLMTLRLWSS